MSHSLALKVTTNFNFVMDMSYRVTNDCFIGFSRVGHYFGFVTWGFEATEMCIALRFQDLHVPYG